MCGEDGSSLVINPMDRAKDDPMSGTEPGADEYAHAPRAAERVPRSAYSTSFLRGLEAREEILKVEEGWQERDVLIPDSVEWVMYPNGDLQRLKF